MPQKVERVVKQVTLTLPNDRIAEIESALVTRYIVGGLTGEDVLHLVGAAILMAIEKGVPIHILSRKQVKDKHPHQPSVRKATTGETGETDE